MPMTYLYIIPEFFGRITLSIEALIRNVWTALKVDQAEFIRLGGFKRSSLQSWLTTGKGRRRPKPESLKKLLKIAPEQFRSEIRMEIAAAEQREAAKRLCEDLRTYRFDVPPDLLASIDKFVVLRNGLDRDAIIAAILRVGLTNPAAIAAASRPAAGLQVISKRKRGS